MLSTPAQIQGRLEELDVDQQARLPQFESAAENYFRLTRDWDRRMAIQIRTANGTSKEVREANALCAAIEQDDLYERFTEAEAKYNALKHVFRTMESRASIGMAILKAQGRA